MEESCSIAVKMATTTVVIGWNGFCPGLKALFFGPVFRSLKAPAPSGFL
jgi:hypothetical protein